MMVSTLHDPTLHDPTLHDPTLTESNLGEPNLDEGMSEGPSTQVRPLRILVVEDDEAVARMMRRMLRSYGEVTLVHDPAEALRLLVATRFDVITCDLVMPGLSGLALLDFARKRCPGARRVLITGSFLVEPESDVYDARLLKPFSRAALIEAVLGAPVACRT